MTDQSAIVSGVEVGDELAGLERDYPAWHVWQSQAGRWWATRLGHVRPHADRGQESGDPEFAITLDADTPAELGQALASQRPHFG